jgi:transcriptional regulator with XRE-family HTH domain
MLSKKELITTPEYWIERLQNEIFRQVQAYMEKEGLNQSQLAIRLGVSKGYVSQILNGNFNFTIKKLIELSLSIDVLPDICFKQISENNNRNLYDTISKSKNRSMVTNVREDEKGYPGRDIDEFQKEPE